MTHTTQTTLPLGTKVCVPTLPPPFIRRGRLEGVLDDATRRAVTLVSAAPGSGKSTLLAGWFRTRALGAGAWLSLDSRDNLPERLTRGILSALSRAGIVPAIDGAEPLDATALEAAFEFMAPDAHYVLVLDDAQELTSPDALATLSHLVDRAPMNLDLVIATRADPPLGLARLRLAGRIGEIRGADLAFTLAEASTLLDAEGLSVDDDDVRALWERTEGWVAGLRLAACSVQRGADPKRLLAGVGAEGAELTDYLVHEVLLRQDKEVQDFLLRTSIADRLTPELAMVLSEDPDAGHRLAELEHRGVFLVRLDRGDWFRYHPLLATLLRGRLRQRDPVLAAALQRRAAEWYASAGLTFEAEELARAGGDWELLGDLLCRRWLNTVFAGDDVAPRMTRGIPTGVVSATPTLSVLAAAEACARHDEIAAEHHRRAVDSAPMASVDGLADPVLLQLATAVLDVLHGCAFGGSARQEAAAALLRSSTAVDARADYFMAVRRAVLRLDVGDLRGAQRELEPLAQVKEPQGLVLEGQAMSALLHAVAGRLSSATERAEGVLACASAPLQAQLIAKLAAKVAAAQRGEAHAPSDGPRSGVTALESRPLRAVEQAVRKWLVGGVPVVDLDDATAYHPLAGRVLVALGVLEVLDSEHHVVSLGGPPEAALGRARAALATGAHAAALTAVESWIGPDAPTSQSRTMIESMVIAAVAWQAQGQHGAANDALRTALMAASVEGALAPLLAHGAALAPSLEHLSTEVGPHQHLAIQLVDAFRQMQPMPFADPLTDREKVVLYFLPTMMTNAEIAASMHLSVNTIKTHLKALYRKLNVERRRDAVVRARQLELL